MKKIYTKDDYEYYLPQMAGIGFVQTQKMAHLGYERHYAKFDNVSIHPVVIDKYGIVRRTDDMVFPIKKYQNGDVFYPNEDAYVSEVKSIFTYVGAEPLSINQQNYDNMHPCKIQKGKRINENIWIFKDIDNSMKPFDMSYQRQLLANQGNIIKATITNDLAGHTNNHINYNKPKPTNKVPDYHQNFVKFSKFVLLNDINASAILVQTGDTEINRSFWVDMRCRDRLFLRLNTSIRGVTIYIFCSDELGYQQPIATSITQGLWYELGECLVPVESHAQSSYEKVMVDGVYRDKFTNLHEIWNTSISVPEANIQKVEYLLQKASSQDCVFHIGTQEPRLDQKVFLGKIEYDSPISRDLEYEINLNGQTIDARIENKFAPNDGIDEWS